MNQSHVSWLTVIPCINSSGGDDRSPAIPTWSVTSPFCTCMPADPTGSQVIGRCALGYADWCQAPLVGGSEQVGVRGAWPRAVATEPGTRRRDGLSSFTEASLAPI